LITIHKTLSRLYLTPFDERKENIDSLENIANTFEKELIRKGEGMPDIENLTELTSIKWQDVQKALKQDEAAIEFIDFQYYDKRWTDSIFYCALLLRKDYTTPKMVYLFEEKQLKNLVSTSKATNNSYYITQLYSNKATLSSINNKTSSQNILYNLIWHPIDSLLNGINTIYLSPSGLLHKVAFNAIPISDSTFLSDKYQLNTVSSTRILAKTSKVMTQLSEDYSVTLYGGVEYDVDSTEMVAIARQFQKPGYDLFANRGITIPEDKRGITWLYLPGTLTEVSNIEKLFESKQITTTLYTGKNATEESFKHLTDNRKSPEIIHIATHGFYFPESQLKSPEMGMDVFRNSIKPGFTNEPAFTYSENPLIRSGILFAGATRAWSNLPEIEGVEDGTLTAYEVSNMNLSNTQLVVLSACETGLGDVNSSEGVIGLQRAFKTAGVRYIIMSLWSIPDYQTSEMMSLFYNNWSDGMNISYAFGKAQKSMRQKYSPYYWAAFVIIE
jgi:CHAT domain-containing protein